MSAEVIHADCTEWMRANLALSGVDVIVTDPPYGIGADERQSNRADKRHGSAMAASANYGATSWDRRRPDAEAFRLMRAIARHLVIWGGNYFADLLPPSASWICWDKDNGTNGYADFELAWTSHDRAARKVRWRWHGMLQQPGFPKDERVHPTQKPLGLLLWVIENYTKPGDLVLDPYCGSGTTGVACAMRGRRFIGIDREAEYVAIARRRIADAQAQLTLEVA